jgi:hypothetical protein
MERDYVLQIHKIFTAQYILHTHTHTDTYACMQFICQWRLSTIEYACRFTRSLQKKSRHTNIHKIICICIYSASITKSSVHQFIPCRLTSHKQCSLTLWSKWLLYIPHALTHHNTAFFARSVSVCSVWFLQRTAAVP